MLVRATMLLTLSLSPWLSARGDDLPEGTGFVDFHHYQQCVKLENDSTRVVLCHQAGGRVLEYSLHGKNALYFDPQEGESGRELSAGRCDIGPEQILPRHPVLWTGQWTAEITGPRQARLTSREDPVTRMQMVREFVLDANSSQLTFTQIVRNVSDATRDVCHWSRTFAQGQGIVVIPLTEPSRFPNKYVMYEAGGLGLLNMRPTDPHVREQDGFLIVDGAPKYPKLGMDAHAGWFAYLLPDDLMFIKQFPADENAVYIELAGLTISIWYPDAPMAEIEPIGPRMRLKPGEADSFTETWTLVEYPFPKERGSVDPAHVSHVVRPLLEQ